MVDMPAGLLYGAVAETVVRLRAKGGSAMVNRGTRPNSWTSLVLTVVFGLLAPACQSTMSVEEAKEVSTAFSGASFAPPPRTITDIEAMLDQQARTTPEVALRRRADGQPPNTTDRTALARFYFNRGTTNRDSRRGIDDLIKALEYWRPGDSLARYDILNELALVELRLGNCSRHLEYRKKAIEAVPNRKGGEQLRIYSESTVLLAFFGELKAAEAALAELSTLYYQSLRWTQWDPKYEARFAQAQAAVLNAQGKYAEAQALYRRAIAAVSASTDTGDLRLAVDLHWQYARSLIHQGQLLEGENEIRTALLGTLATYGRNSWSTAWMLGNLGWVLLEQGRYQESERIARAGIATYEKFGTAPDSRQLAA